jgi:hypothetical protein
VCGEVIRGWLGGGPGFRGVLIEHRHCRAITRSRNHTCSRPPNTPHPLRSQVPPDHNPQITPVVVPRHYPVQHAVAVVGTAGKGVVVDDVEDDAQPLGVEGLRFGVVCGGGGG